MEGLRKEVLIDLRRDPHGVGSGLLNALWASLGTCRYKLQAGDPERAVELLHRYDVHYLLYIGGNDSADTAHQLALATQHAGYELQTISVPKTIANDLPFTDHCPGYGSPARLLALAT